MCRICRGNRSYFRYRLLSSLAAGHKQADNPEHYKSFFHVITSWITRAQMTDISSLEKWVFRYLLPSGFHILFLKPVVPSGHRSLPETWHSSWYLKSNGSHAFQTGHPHLHGYDVWYFHALRRWLHSPTDAVTDCFCAMFWFRSQTERWSYRKRSRR